MRVAIVHYWLVGMRGGEKVLEELCTLYPQADIFTHVYVPQKISPLLQQHRIQTTFVQKLPFAKYLYQRYLPFMPLALEQLDLRAYDLVISSESGPAKGVLTNASTPHICYCHSPMRYVWDFYQDYLEEAGPLIRPFMRPLLHSIRQWDALSAQRVDYFIANSHYIARRIAKHYRRQAAVIYPPVGVERFLPVILDKATQQDEYLCLGQLVGYKKIDLAVEAFRNTDRKLLIVGEGRQRRALEKRATANIRFAGWQNEAETTKAVQQCRALIFPGEEDFGMVPVELMAAGKPVIAYGRGGALETVLDGISGVLFQEQSVTALQDALERFEALEPSLDPSRMVSLAQGFSPHVFREKFAQFVEQAMEDFAVSPPTSNER